MEKLKIEKAKLEHVEGIEKIHLSYFSEIGEKSGSVADNLKRNESLAFVALDNSSNVVGYILSATYGSQNFFEWFGVSDLSKGIAKVLFERYLMELVKENVKESILYSRNRFILRKFVLCYVIRLCSQ